MKQTLLNLLCCVLAVAIGDSCQALADVISDAIVISALDGSVQRKFRTEEDEMNGLLTTNGFFRGRTFEFSDLNGTTSDTVAIGTFDFSFTSDAPLVDTDTLCCEVDDFVIRIEFGDLEEPDSDVLDIFFRGGTAPLTLMLTEADEQAGILSRSGTFPGMTFRFFEPAGQESDSVTIGPFDFSITSDAPTAEAPLESFESSRILSVRFASCSPDTICDELAVPEPSTWLLLGIGLMGLGANRYRRKLAGLGG